jgi:polar amino acid transport system substrate-binding protein
MKSALTTIRSGVTAVLIIALTASSSFAASDTLLNSAKAGGKVRLGFANEVPWAYPGENNKPLGFVNAIALGTLKSMGIENIEPVVTDWGGLIPGLKANRYDLVTGGMYILKSRCENMDFSDPIGVFGDVFVVPKGNPKKIQTYEDIIATGSVLVTGAGYNIVEVARKQGVPGDNIMQVPGPTEMLAALLAGRADAIGTNTFGAQVLANQSGGKAELTDPANMPDWTMNWVGIGFRPENSAFREAFNAAQAKYIGSPEMLAKVAEYGYTKMQLPGKSASTAYACANR